MAWQSFPALFSSHSVCVHSSNGGGDDDVALLQPHHYFSSALDFHLLFRHLRARTFIATADLRRLYRKFELFRYPERVGKTRCINFLIVWLLRNRFWQIKWVQKCVNIYLVDKRSRVWSCDSGRVIWIIFFGRRCVDYGRRGTFIYQLQIGVTWDFSYRGVKAKQPTALGSRCHMWQAKVETNIYTSIRLNGGQQFVLPAGARITWHKSHKRTWAIFFHLSSPRRARARDFALVESVTVRLASRRAPSCKLQLTAPVVQFTLGRAPFFIGVSRERQSPAVLNEMSKI